MKLIVFDLDGTLVDSLKDIATSMNQVLATYGRERLLLRHYEGLVGGGTLNMVRQSCDKSFNVDTMHAEFSACYKKNFLVQTRAYEGAGRLLSTLVSENIRLAVLSNKSQPLVEKIVETFFPDIPFSHVIGLSDLFPKKPAPDALLHIIDDTPAAEVLMIGDTIHDSQTAQLAGVSFAAVDWGYGSRQSLMDSAPDMYFYDMSDVLTYINKLIKQRAPSMDTDDKELVS